MGKKKDIIDELEKLKVPHNPSDHWKKLEKQLEEAKAKPKKKQKPGKKEVEQPKVDQKKLDVIAELEKLKVPHDPNVEYEVLKKLLGAVKTSTKEDLQPEKIKVNAPSSLKGRTTERQQEIIAEKMKAFEKLADTQAFFKKLYKEMKGVNNTLARKAHTVDRQLEVWKRFFK